MLGIRIYQNIALDLWVGPKELFNCDVIVEYDNNNINLEALLDKKVRHLAIFIKSFAIQNNTEQKLIQFFYSVKLFLKDINIYCELIKRISFLFEEKKYYDIAINLFFDCFPETRS